MRREWIPTLFLLATTGLVSAASVGPTQCLAFDVGWNLLAFGFGGKDYNATTQDSWGTAGSATDITSQGRPPFDSPNIACYLSQYSKAIYVINGDMANPTNVYIYDAAAKSWSSQATSTAPASPGQPSFDPTNFAAILDHDTDVFYAYSNQEIFALDMFKAGTSTPIPWTSVQNPEFGANYDPVMAFAQNHIHFLDVFAVPAGSAKIFVLDTKEQHMQPEAQHYGNFPAVHGCTASFFLDTGVQQEFVFIPDDGSATYIINAESNTTTTFAGPTVKDSLATYTASTNSLVQMSRSSGGISWMGYDQNKGTGTGWTTLTAVPSNSNEVRVDVDVK